MKSSGELSRSRSAQKVNWVSTGPEWSGRARMDHEVRSTPYVWLVDISVSRQTGVGSIRGYCSLILALFAFQQDIARAASKVLLIGLCIEMLNPSANN
jgi:hypothetical protein